jgi:putative methyltransferase (TIGR04325 family)
MMLIPDLEYVPEGWARAQHDSTIMPGDANGASQLPGHLERWPAFTRVVQDAGPLGINHELPLSPHESPRTDDLGAHNTVISFGYVLALTAARKDRFSILDWGGGIGQYYVLAKALIPGIEIDYSCKDASELCVHGGALLPDATFYNDDKCFDRTYDLVVASGSLTLSENWSGLLDQLGRAADEYVYIARLPIASQSHSFVMLQRGYSLGLDVGWLQWALSRAEFVGAAVESDLELVREFLSDESIDVPRAPGRIESRHFLFQKPKPLKRGREQ